MTRTAEVLATLRQFESRNVTFIDPDGGWPIVWDRACGVHVWDVEGHRYLDLTAAFGVAAAGHANPRVVAAGQRQLARLPHAMGDVHPHETKAQLARVLSDLTFGRWQAGLTGKVIFGSSGSEAVEAALKTARVATGRAGVIAFEGGYHGVGYGALNVTQRGHFRDPFLDQLRAFGRFLPFPVDSTRSASEAALPAVRQALAAGDSGALLLEPIQARGGIRVPHPSFLAALRKLTDEAGGLLIVDEIYTGFGRTGKWFAVELSRVIPDLICLGKALAGGYPISACVGRSDLMDRAWPNSDGEAIHTSTFLGNPVGCAMALAQIAEIRRLRLPPRSAAVGALWQRELRRELKANVPVGRRLQIRVRGRGLMIGVELCDPEGRPATTACLAAVKALLKRGIIVLPEGEHGNVIGFTPPLIFSATATRRVSRILVECLL